MLPSFLITFREVLEATLIVATIIAILTKIGQPQNIRTVWLATSLATLTSILFLIAGSLLGFEVQEWYKTKESYIEGTLMIISAIFITSAVFFLHNYFGHFKTNLLSRIKKSVNQGLFILTFSAVFREGFEIVLFLSTVYLSSNPIQILSGFLLGVASAIVICFGLFTATVRMPVFYAFRVTSALLILFAAGLLAQGAHEFVEYGIINATPNVYLPFLPEKSTFIGSTIQTMFGLTRKMEVQTLALYLTYTAVMAWWVFLHRVSKEQVQASEQAH